MRTSNETVAMFIEMRFFYQIIAKAIGKNGGDFLCIDDEMIQLKKKTLDYTNI